MSTKRNSDQTLFELTESVRSFYKSLSQQVLSQRVLAQQFEGLNNQLGVLNSLDTYLADAPELKPKTFKEDMKDLEPGDDVRFKFLAGTCPTIKVGTLRKQIYLITRGNRYFKCDPLENDPKTSAFVVFFIGEYSRNLIRKFCTWMEVDVFLDSSEKMDASNVTEVVEKKIAEHEDL